MQRLPDQFCLYCEKRKKERNRQFFLLCTSFVNRTGLWEKWNLVARASLSLCPPPAQAVFALFGLAFAFVYFLSPGFLAACLGFASGLGFSAVLAFSAVSGSTVSEFGVPFCLLLLFRFKDDDLVISRPPLSPLLTLFRRLSLFVLRSSQPLCNRSSVERLLWAAPVWYARFAHAFQSSFDLVTLFASTATGLRPFLILVHLCALRCAVILCAPFD